MKLTHEGTAKPNPEDIIEGLAIPFNQLIATLPKCGRCGSRHRNFAWREWKRHAPVYDGRVVATHWGMCPIMGEPVLGLFLDDQAI